MKKETKESPYLTFTCENCHSVFETHISCVDGVWQGVCPECGEVFFTTVPKGKYAICFAQDEDGSNPFFTDDYCGEGIIVYEAFENETSLYKRWKEIVENPLGMWYWIINTETNETYVSGAVCYEDILRLEGVSDKFDKIIKRWRKENYYY